MAVETIEITSRHPVPAARIPGVAPVRVVARGVTRGALLWGAAFGVIVWALAADFVNEYPTAAARAQLIRSMASNTGWPALFGPVHHVATAAGYTSSHISAVLGLIGAVWGLLVGTRLLRGEEEAGRWELLLAGQTTRRRAAAAGVAGLGIGLLTLWAVTAAATIAVGRSAEARFPVGASLFAAVTAVATAGMFLAVGALCSQLAATRRQATGLAAGAFGVVYLIRLVAYSGTSVRGLRWASPLTWVDELHPLTAGGRPMLLMPISGAIAALVAATIILAGQRDVGASILPAKDAAVARTRLLTGPLGLGLRLGRRSALGWLAGLGAGGLIVGMLAKTTGEIWRDQSGGVMQNLGGAPGQAAYLGISFLIIALLVGMAASGQVVATREEESEGYVDHLLARPVGRLSWLAGRLALSIAALVLLGVAAGLSTWVGAVATGAGLGLGSLVAAGINVVPVGVLVLGIGTLVHGLAPRSAGRVAYGVVAWSFLVEVVGAGVGVSHWLLDTSVLHHIARAPAADVRWHSAAVLVAAGLVVAAIGAWRFTRRDLAGT